MEIRVRTIGGLAGCNDIATSGVTRILLLLGCQLCVYNNYELLSIIMWHARFSEPYFACSYYPFCFFVSAPCMGPICALLPMGTAHSNNID